MKSKFLKIAGAMTLLAVLSQCMLDGDYKMFGDGYGDEGSSMVAAKVAAEPSYSVDMGTQEALETGL